jgi:hypothetical protein
MTATADPGAYLGATRYLDLQHPKIRALAERLTASASCASERAVRIHDFVRDAIPFGWAPAFDRQAASEVLASGVGFCNTKSTLFIALLRASGIPSRLHVAGITVGVLEQLIDPRSAYVDHSWTELWLDDRWIKLDSYVMDRQLFCRALALLRRRGGTVGCGLHVHGAIDWDGAGDCFVQFVDDGSTPGFSDCDFGIWHDIGEFNSSGRARTPQSPLVRLILRTLLRGANRRVRAIRALPADASR